MGERADARTWTCEVRSQEGRLPDLGAMAQGIRDLGLGATLRGVEATVEGTLIEGAEGLSLALFHTHEIVRLAPLRRKVQWDVARKRPQRLTRAERTAYERLQRRRPTGSPALRVVGVLVATGNGECPRLEVREITEIPEPRSF